MKAGVALVDITPGQGLQMSGFAARTEPSLGAHDPLTVRALVVDDTALVAVDVVGLHEDMVARIRQRSALPDRNIIIAAIHTHGAPVSMPGRLGSVADPAFLDAIEDACVAAIEEALGTARPARITVGMGPDPDVARNRRHDGGPVDPAVPMLRFRDARTDEIFAVLTSYACHPVVLGADNRLLTADYCHYVRAEIEATHPGAVAVFLTGCTGDANNGHSAHASWTLAANPERSFEMAERLGRRIGKAALAAGEAAIGPEAYAVAADVLLRLTRLEREPLPALAETWRGELEGADPVRRIVLEAWIEWTERFADVPPGSWTGRVSVFDWGGVPIVALPGEIFAETGLLIREACGNRPAFVVSYANGTPGYIPPASEFVHGGYEVEEAHRFIGMPGTFSPGSAEALAGAAQALLDIAGLRR